MKCTVCSLQGNWNEHVVVFRGYLLIVKACKHKQAFEHAYNRLSHDGLTDNEKIEVALVDWFQDLREVPIPDGSLLYWQRPQIMAQ
jgi:hypothetical protein